MRKTSSVLLLLLAGALGAGSPEGRFLLIGDWGRGPDNAPLHAAQRAVAEAMGRSATQRPVSAVIALGDNFYPNGAATVDSPLFASAFEKVYAAPSLQVPFWVALGNHDYQSPVQGQLDYSAQRKGSGRWTLPARYWSRTVEVAPGTRAKFIVLDTCPFVRAYARSKAGSGLLDAAKQDTAAQLAWLEKELAEPGVGWRIVCGHHPIWSGGNHGDTAELKERLLPVLLRHKVQLYACGHDHHAEVFVREGLTALISGNASEVRDIKLTEGSVYRGAHTGFAELTLGADRGEVRLIDAEGQARFTQPLAR